MRGAMPPFPNTSSGLGAQLKRWDNFTFKVRFCWVVLGVMISRLGYFRLRYTMLV
jgi:hypothetical protein